MQSGRNLRLHVVINFDRYKMIVYEFRQLRPLIALAIHLRTIRTSLRSQVEKDWSVEIFGFSKRFLSPRIPIDQLLARVLKIRRLASFQVVGACRSGRGDLCRRARCDQGAQERREFAQ